MCPTNKGKVYKTWKGKVNPQAKSRNRIWYKKATVRMVITKKRGGRSRWKGIERIGEIESVYKEYKEKYLSEWISSPPLPTHTWTITIPFKLHSTFRIITGFLSQAKLYSHHNQVKFYCGTLYLGNYSNSPSKFDAINSM